MTMTRPTIFLRPPRARLFTAEEYYRMAENGFFINQRVELLDGEVIEMSPQNEPHITAISRLNRFLNSTVPLDYEVRCQAPLSLGTSEPEPDFAIVKLPKPKNAHPTTAVLVIEVADSSLLIDRKKSHLYAAAQIPEYWLLNLQTRSIERHANPIADPASLFAAKYETITHHPASDSLAPLTLQLPPISIATLFDIPS